jgi:hypothetical protein
MQYVIHNHLVMSLIHSLEIALKLKTYKTKIDLTLSPLL